ncbi:MAG: hypothetical protein KF861_20620 [Planctomycetaceae bacterium]|nr:hypothetical protein [Planctomycetaceae bacterium]
MVLNPPSHSRCQSAGKSDPDDCRTTGTFGIITRPRFGPTLAPQSPSKIPRLLGDHKPTPKREP